jgi:hypothetical protein
MTTISAHTTPSGLNQEIVLGRAPAFNIILIQPGDCHQRSVLARFTVRYSFRTPQPHVLSFID